VIVATVRALKYNGGVAKADLGKENVAAVVAGSVNLARLIENVRQFGVPAVVAINRFASDTGAEIGAVREIAAAHGVEAVICTHFADGSAGAAELADRVAALADGDGGQFAPLYDADMGQVDKINAIATRIYRADEAIANSPVRNQLHQWEKDGYGHLPVCMAKTQYSFSTDPALLGAPSPHVVPVREVRLSAGAGFIVAVCGDLMTMPGLPKVPSAEGMRVDGNGLIEGLS
jgi:formate--tetrahydrofolate ligase